MKARKAVVNCSGKALDAKFPIQAVAMQIPGRGAHLQMLRYLLLHAPTLHTQINKPTVTERSILHGTVVKKKRKRTLENFYSSISSSSPVKKTSAGVMPR